jgi:hypothetical protein
MCGAEVCATEGRAKQFEIAAAAPIHACKE